MRGVFILRGRRDFPIPLRGIGTTSCVAYQFFYVDAAFHSLDVAFELKRLCLCGELLCPDQFPWSFAFGGPRPSFVVTLASKDRVVG